MGRPPARQAADLLTANGSTSRRGYGWRHQLERAKVKRLVDAGLARCARCGGVILAGQKWHLDHADHPQAHELGLYIGPSHAYCNNAHKPVRPREPAPALQSFFNTKQARRQ